MLCSHAPDDRFGLYLIDRYGNRELLHMDPAIGAMSPTLWRPVAPPPDFPATPEEEPEMGRFVVADVYQGLAPDVQRGRVKYLRVCQELRADLLELPGGSYQADHEPFQDWYATPTHKVLGPNGWPSYVAKAVLGLARVEDDGSANFLAPAGKVLYFQALDNDFNELQRMRSVVQLQPGETRSCVGCHENRLSAPPVRAGHGVASSGRAARAAPLGSRAVRLRAGRPARVGRQVRQLPQPAGRPTASNLTAALDRRRRARLLPHLDRPAAGSTTSTTSGDRSTTRPTRSPSAPLKSKLWEVLDKGHYDVQLTQEEKHRIKCWTDLNCPLWSDYQFRQNRLTQNASR